MMEKAGLIYARPVTTWPGQNTQQGVKQRDPPGSSHVPPLKTEAHPSGFLQMVNQLPKHFKTHYKDSMDHHQYLTKTPIHHHNSDTIHSNSLSPNGHNPKHMRTDNTPTSHSTPHTPLTSWTPAIPGAWKAFLRWTGYKETWQYSRLSESFIRHTRGAR